MHQTDLDMRSRYKETSLGGLAAIVDLDRDGMPDIALPKSAPRRFFGDCPERIDSHSHREYDARHE